MTEQDILPVIAGFIKDAGALLGGFGTLLVGIAGIKAVKTYTAPKLTGTLSSIVIEHERIRIRELKEDDFDRIVELARNFSMDTTAALYEQYNNNRKEVENKMRGSNLSELVDLFTSFDKQADSTIPETDRAGNFREFLTACGEDKLFCPYGVLQAPFSTSVHNYIKRAINTARENPRDEFRMGVEYNNQLIGCFVFDFIKKTVVDYQTIGDFGMFGESAMMTHPGAIYYPVVYFLEGMLPASQKKKIHIGVTLHPCDYVRAPFFAPEYGFYKVDAVEYLYDNRKRNRFIVKYTDFAKKILAENQGRAQPKIVQNGRVKTRAGIFRFHK